MNRFDERRPRFWRHDRERDRDDRFRGDEYEFQRDEDTGRTAGGPEHQPYSGNPYGRYPGQDRSQREWGGRWGRGPEGAEDRYASDRYSSEGRYNREPRQNYGQREPYNARGGSSFSRWGGPSNEEGSRYSESQYGMRRSRLEPYGDRYEHEFGEGPFADTSESPRYFGTGYYGEGGSSYTGGYDQRDRRPYPGSLGEDTLSTAHRGEREQRRYRPGPKGYTRSDERIREDISERLMLADSIDSSEVTVSVKDGRVTLEGTVPTRSMKHSIEDLADHTAGVQDVDNRIRVERFGTSSSSGVQTASGVTPTSGSPKTTKQ